MDAKQQRVIRSQISKIQLRSRCGFSLIELMIVIVIIATLSAIAVPIYQNNVAKAKRSEVMVTMAFVQNYLEIYYGTEGRYPIASNWENVVGSDWNDIPTGALKGKYYLSKYYDYQSEDGVAYRIRCYWDNGNVANFWVDEAGRWSWNVPIEDW